MLRNYAKMVVRNVRRHAGYAAINIGGLALGLACCLMIVLYVGDELSFDRFHANAGRIASSHGSAKATPVPRSSVLRERRRRSP